MLTFAQLLDIVHPAARILTDIARSQDAEVGDGTTSVVVLAGEILKDIRDFVDQGVSSQTIMKGLRRASAMAVNKVKEIAVSTSDGNQRDTLRKLAATAMSSKLIHRNADFFTKSELACIVKHVLNSKLILSSGRRCRTHTRPRRPEREAHRSQEGHWRCITRLPLR